MSNNYFKFVVLIINKDLLFMKEMPKVISYVMTYDTGFAPNPYFKKLTLATCKPVIKRHLYGHMSWMAVCV